MCALSCHRTHFIRGAGQGGAHQYALISLVSSKRWTADGRRTRAVTSMSCGLSGPSLLRLSAGPFCSTHFWCICLACFCSACSIARSGIHPRVTPASRVALYPDHRDSGSLWWSIDIAIEVENGMRLDQEQARNRWGSAAGTPGTAGAGQLRSAGAASLEAAPREPEQREWLQDVAHNPHYLLAR